jgi:hypothetical protein
MKRRDILIIVLFPFQLAGIFLCVKQLSGSQETALRMVEITGGICIVVGLAIFLSKKLNKSN